MDGSDICWTDHAQNVGEPVWVQSDDVAWERGQLRSIGDGEIKVEVKGRVQAIKLDRKGRTRRQHVIHRDIDAERKRKVSKIWTIGSSFTKDPCINLHSDSI